MKVKIDGITLLSEDQVYDNTIIKTIGKKCAVTDFAILLGAYVSNDIHVGNNSSRKGLTGWWYLKSSTVGGDLCVVDQYGNVERLIVAANRAGGIRPILQVSHMQAAATRGTNGVMEVEYGEYPQYAVSMSLGNTLENEFLKGKLRKTGKKYTTDSTRWNAADVKFKPIEHEEFEYHNKKYIRVNSNCYEKGFTLSNDVGVLPNHIVWVKVEPIKWYVDEKEKILISKNLLAGGVRFCDIGKYRDDFKNTEMYTFLNTYFAKDIQPAQLTEEDLARIKKEQQEQEKRRNPFNLKPKKVLEEDIIRESIECGVPVFLHGRSSEGKSARIKQIDPDCIILYLRNTTPEGLNGKSIYDQSTGKIIDVKPTWLEKLEKKCNAEPNKNHILFLDELTNALPSIQGMAFNIVLDKEVNGIWKLPENARIVAAGNDMKDSLAANKLAEPLFNRFCHVYIETTTEKWLKWAAENKIHPAIYSFIAYKGESVLRSEFNGETPNADPRKWEMASKMLYKTSNPEILRGLIGEEITNEFTEFCRTQVITLEDVLSDNFDTNQMQELDTSERYATVMALSCVEEKDIEIVRNFIKNFDGEFISLFDMLWSNGDEERLAILAELNIKEKII